MYGINDTISCLHLIPLVCFLLCSSGNLTGSIISSTILTPKDATYLAEDWHLQYCGANDCPGSNITQSGLNNPSETTVKI